MIDIAEIDSSLMISELTNRKVNMARFSSDSQITREYEDRDLDGLYSGRKYLRDYGTSELEDELCNRGVTIEDTMLLEFRDMAQKINTQIVPIDELIALIERASGILIVPK